MVPEQKEWDVTPEHFEEMVAALEEVLVPGARVTRDVWLVDRNGVRRQIDVLLDIPVGPRRILHAIECRRRLDVADITWIDEVESKYRDLPQIDGRTAVSAVGFSEGAKKKAAEHNIELLCLAETDTLDWRIQFGIRHTNVVNYSIEYRHVGVFLQSELAEIPQPAIAGMTWKDEVFELEGGERRSVDQLLRANWETPRGLADAAAESGIAPFRVRLHVTDDLPIWLVVDGERYLVEGLDIEGAYHVVSAEQVPFATPREYVEVESGLVRAGIMEASRVAVINGREMRIGFHYLPPDEDSGLPSRLQVSLRPIEGQADNTDEGDEG